MSELAKQLRQLQQSDRTQGGTPFSSKLKASILFSEQEAADLDAESLLALGLHGLHELQAMDPAFLAYEVSLFGSASGDRSLLTAEENAELNGTLEHFLRRLGPHFLHPATPKCLEWLIRRHRVHELNVPYLLATFLPFHEHPQFIRLVQLCFFEDGSQWGFLFPVKQEARTVNRSYLVGRLLADPSLLDCIWRIVQTQADGGHEVYASFFTMLCIEWIDRVFADAVEPDLARLSQAIAICHKALAHPNLTLTGLVLTMELARQVRLTPTALAELVEAAKQHATPAQLGPFLESVSQ